MGANIPNSEPVLSASSPTSFPVVLMIDAPLAPKKGMQDFLSRFDQHRVFAPGDQATDVPQHAPVMLFEHSEKFFCTGRALGLVHHATNEDRQNLMNRSACCFFVQVQRASHLIHGLIIDC